MGTVLVPLEVIIVRSWFPKLKVIVLMPIALPHFSSYGQRPQASNLLVSIFSITQVASQLPKILLDKVCEFAVKEINSTEIIDSFILCCLLLF